MQPFGTEQKAIIREILFLLDGLTNNDCENIICTVITSIYGDLKGSGQEEIAEYYFDVMTKKINYLYENRDCLEKIEE
jgi:hypothetical protein